MTHISDCFPPTHQADNAMTRDRIHLEDLLKILKLAQKAIGQEKKLASSKLIAYEEPERDQPEAGMVDWDIEASHIAPALATLVALVDHLAFPDTKQFVFVVPGTEPEPERAKLTPITIGGSVLEQMGVPKW